mmetsp:Transcript_42540/g.65378  ORF Transcript_42540/g.65378 Transcript_42540/m.65378 type:complete len:212 (-) Transcript_42540:57-692(-)
MNGFARMPKKMQIAWVYFYKKQISYATIEKILWKPGYFGQKKSGACTQKKLENFKELEYSESAVHCLNHLITNALEHVPDVLEYMKNVKEPSVFLFCAIPQVMAIATLAKCFNNHEVFMGVVKIRRGETAKIFTAISDMDSVCTLFGLFANVIAGKIDESDPNAERTKQIVEKIIVLCGNPKPNSQLTTMTTVVGAAVAVSSVYACYQLFV